LKNGKGGIEAFNDFTSSVILVSSVMDLALLCLGFCAIMLRFDSLSLFPRA
jgi:hypothetical protein